MTKKQSEKQRIKITDRRVGNSVDQDTQAPETEVEPGSARPAEAIDETVSTDAAAAGIGDAAIDEPGVTDWEAQARENLELAQRKQADLDNFRKRSQQDRDDIRRNAVEALLYDLFPALDGLSQAAHTFSDKPEGEDALLDGVRNTVKVLDRAFERHGIERICRSGVPFDPSLHQALAVSEAEGIDVDTVDEIYTEGYLIGDRVLKPAMVSVAKPISQKNEDAGKA